jgi:hypothetical protein
MVVVLSDLRQLEEARANAPRAVVEMSLRIMGVVWVMGWRRAGTVLGFWKLRCGIRQGLGNSKEGRFLVKLGRRECGEAGD